MTRQLSRPMALVLTLMLLAPLLLVQPPATSAVAPATDPFQRTWARTDQPVASGTVSRTWMWGPEAFTEGMWEDYAESPNGQRLVQYFDKSRMELTNPDAVDDGVWYVTNGLLVVEMMTGEMQTGDHERVQRAPANVNVAGDPDDPLTYAVLAQRRGDAPLSVGAAVTQRINASGQVSNDPGLGGYNVTAATLVTETDHTVASVFWDFMHASGPVHTNGQTVTDQLFVSPFYATGFPITEAYWATVKIGGTPHEVLLQCFERRCLTYAPQNPDGWQVEAGNVGQHYYAWRYGQQAVADGPSALANQLAAKVKTATADETRYQALLEVMNHLNVGVYTGDGAVVLSGAEQSWNDFYLYDFQVYALSRSLGRGDTWNVIELAMQLTGMELLPEGEIIEPSVMQEILQAAVASAAQTPNDPLSLVPLLVRQLGLYGAEPYDLFEAVAIDEMQLDALAYFLIILDSTVPLIASDLPVAAMVSSNLIAQSNGILKPADTHGHPCTVPYGAKKGWHLFTTAAEMMHKLPKIAGKALPIIDGIHGSALAFSVRVTMRDERLETHYGPIGHTGRAGAELRFQLKVEMLDDYGSLIVNCGWILGTDFPAKGGIPEVSVHWLFEGLNQHGEINCGNACVRVGETGLSLEATDKNGIATLIFRPRQEILPGIGPQVEETGIVTGIALYQSKFWNFLGSFAQYLTPKMDATRWFIERHKPRGYKVEATFQHTSEGITIYYTYRLRVCGDDAYGKAWNGELALEIPQFIDTTFTIPSEAVFSRGASSSEELPETVWERGGSRYTWYGGTAELRIVEGQPSTMHIDAILATVSFTKSVSIEEDTSCPAD